MFCILVHECAERSGPPMLGMLPPQGLCICCASSFVYNVLPTCSWFAASLYSGPRDAISKGLDQSRHPIALCCFTLLYFSSQLPLTQNCTIDLFASLVSDSCLRKCVL